MSFEITVAHENTAGKDSTVSGRTLMSSWKYPGGWAGVMSIQTPPEFSETSFLSPLPYSEQ